MNIYVDGELVDVQNIKATSADKKVTVYNVNGIVVRRGVQMKDALKGLPSGFYIVDGVKYVVR